MNRTSIKNLFEKDIEGQDIERYKAFVVTFDNSKLNLSIRNKSVSANKERKIVIDDEEEHKD